MRLGTHPPKYSDQRGNHGSEEPEVPLGGAGTLAAGREAAMTAWAKCNRVYVPMHRANLQVNVGAANGPR